MGTLFAYVGAKSLPLTPSIYNKDLWQKMVFSFCAIFEIRAVRLLVEFFVFISAFRQEEVK